MDRQAKTAFHYVDNATQLAGLLDGIRQVSRVAIDTEADSFHHYYPKVCLMQLSFNGDNYIVDPLAGLDLTDFLAVLLDKVLIIHDAGYDLRMMRETFGFEPKAPIFDTMLAARLLGIEKFGLAALLGQFFGVEMSKQGQRSDWSRRPLQESQLAYAVLDTHYLTGLADMFEQKLRALGRDQWHREWCDWSVRAAMTDKDIPDPDKAWRFRGTSTLNPSQMAFARQLWLWRQGQAQQADLPPFKIMGNEPLLKLAVWAERTPARPIEHGPGLPRNCRGQRLNLLKQAVVQARAMKPDQWPKPPQRTKCPDYVAENRHLVETLRSRCANIAAELKLAPQVLASRATLEQIAYGKPTNIPEMVDMGQMMTWQGQLLGETIIATIHEHTAD